MDHDSRTKKCLDGEPMLTNSTPCLLWIQAISSIALVGLIWTIQIVHYPLFSLVGEEKFTAYQHEHMKRITWVVGPLMLVEIVAATLIVIVMPQSYLAWLGFSLVGIIWISTVLLQVPCHTILTHSFDSKAHNTLVKTNWIRTIAWTLRGVIVVLMLLGS